MEEDAEVTTRIGVAVAEGRSRAEGATATGDAAGAGGAAAAGVGVTSLATTVFVVRQVAAMKTAAAATNTIPRVSLLMPRRGAYPLSLDGPEERVEEKGIRRVSLRAVLGAEA
jgi:hypothetical protein